MTDNRLPAPREMSPVFVFGVDHSGTTILYRMLAYHPDLTWFSQFSLRGGEIPGRRRRLIADRLDSGLRRLPHPWRKEETGLIRMVIPCPGEEGDVWRYLLGGRVHGRGSYSLQLDVVQRAEQRRRVLAKRTAFHRHLGLLRTAFPRARFVHIVRDGRPVALSLRAKDLARSRRGAEAMRGDLGAALRRLPTTGSRLLTNVDESPRHRPDRSSLRGLLL